MNDETQNTEQAELEADELALLEDHDRELREVDKQLAAERRSQDESEIGASAMTSAEREARDRTFKRQFLAPSRREAFDDGWAAGVEYVRGATVAEIVEAIGIEILNNRDPGDWQAVIDFIEARFSPAAPTEHPGGDTR